MNFQQIRTKKIYEEIIEQIRSLIARRELKPGDKLPSERELAESLGVSRASVREALSALEVLGVLEVRPGEGTFVREVAADKSFQSLTLLLLLDTTLEVLEVRKILESGAIVLATERATDEDIERLEEAVLIMEKDLKQGDLGDEADFMFHYGLALATHNSLLVRLMNSIADTMRQSLKINRERLFRTPGMPEIFYKYHKEILEAIKDRDKIRAQKVLEEHLTVAEEKLLEE
ncbi:FadR/GntR family transcriptional regulator [Carboxydothermus pertinax]|uniref:GntR family transcriptional regulator n=1 Tax=Carboxydothermus pertinax TaxID=870242 RepID=A0A1L8CT22_9THEO|nr:FadR/GntR family transcriptional regulator [Carboxydothermus pertinax]GAV22061.1 GntR family transcriptional regulator [Carboxydothermus pertinax]